jgi:translocation and assembly module TamA
VDVKGLDDELQKNVLARLELYLHRESPRLSVYDIRRLHRQADENIRSALAPYGYYSPDITSTLNNEGEDYRADYIVRVGKPVLVNTLSIRVTGDGSGIIESAVKAFPLKIGDVLDQGKYEEGKKKLIRAALRRGYLKASFVVRELRVNRSERQAEIDLVLETGPLYTFGKTTFQHNSLRSELLNLYLPYKEGDPYQPSKIIELQKGLYRTEYFSRVVADGNVDGSVDLAVPVTVRLTSPEHLNRYTVGLGYATDTGARARFEWWNRLLNSRGHRIRGSLQASEFDNTLGLNYEIPWRDPRDDNMAFNSAYHDQIWEDTETRLLTAGVQVEHKGDLIRHSGSVEFRDEDYSVGSTSGSSKLIMPTYTGTVIWADDILDTNYGLELSLSVSGAGKSLGSDASFVKTVVGGKLIVSFLPGWRFIGRGSLGATLVDSIDDLPPSLRFYTGGDQSIRGYAYKEIGTTDSSGAVVGGRYLAVGSAEIEKKVTEAWSLATFWDVGNATDDLNLDFKQGVGAGVRYRLPFGQVRLDVASAVLEDGTPIRIHLTVGADL